MSNAVKGHYTSLENWINNPGIKKGILSLYAGDPFDYEDNRAGYEIGRQIAIAAKNYGLKTRGTILRKRQNSQSMAIVKTKMEIMRKIVYHDLGFTPSQLAVERY